MSERAQTVTTPLSNGAAGDLETLKGLLAEHGVRKASNAAVMRACLRLARESMGHRPEVVGPRFERALTKGK